MGKNCQIPELRPRNGHENRQRHLTLHRRLCPPPKLPPPPLSRFPRFFHELPDRETTLAAVRRGESPPYPRRGIHRNGVRGPRLLHHRRRRPGRRRGGRPAWRASQGNCLCRRAPRVRRPRCRRGILHGGAPGRRRPRPR